MSTYPHTHTHTAAATASADRAGLRMKKFFINPQGRNNFSQIVTATSSQPVTTIWLAGMVAPIGSKEFETGTLRDQAANALQQVEEALAKCGAKVDDVVRFNVYIKEISQEKIVEVAKAMFKVSKHLSEEKQAASTYVGVTALAHPKMLVEIEATAQILAVDSAAAASATAAAPGRVTKVHMNPQGGRYCQIVTTTCNGPCTTLWVSGQTGTPETMEKPIKEQVAAAMRSMKQVLAEKGASFKDVARFNTYVPFLDDAKIPGYREAMAEALADLPDDQKPANTLLGVTGLLDPKMQLECEAVAVIPAEFVPETGIRKEFVGPDEKLAFSQAVATTTVPGPSCTTLWLAGMTASGTKAETLGIQEQTEAALQKLVDALAKCGGKFDDVVILQTYVKNLYEDRQEKAIGFSRALNKFTKHIPRNQRASNSFIGVTGLATPTLLVEIQATALLPWGLDLGNLAKL